MQCSVRPWAETLGPRNAIVSPVLCCRQRHLLKWRPDAALSNLPVWRDAGHVMFNLQEFISIP